MQWIKAAWLLPVLMVLTAAMHSMHIGKDLAGYHVQRQITAHTITRLYAEQDINLLHPQLYEKGHTTSSLEHELPLHHWLTAGLHRLLGPDIWVARLTVFLFGLITVLGIYALSRNVFQHSGAAAATAWVFTFSPNFYYYSLTPTPDVFALMLSVWSLALFYRWMRKRSGWLLAGSTALLTLAAFCNASALVLLSVPLGHFLLKAVTTKEGKEQMIANATLLLLPLLLPIAWQSAMPPEPTPQNVPANSWLDSALHHLGITLPELMVNYAALPLLVAGIVLALRRRGWQNPFYQPLMIGTLACVVSIALRLTRIGNFHEEALFLLYPFLMLVIGAGLLVLWKQSRKWLAWGSIVLVLATPATAFLRMNPRWTPKHPGFNADVMTYASDLQGATSPEEVWVVGNDASHCAFLYHARHPGFAFKDDSLPAVALERFIQQGATYLLSDSRAIEESAEIQQWKGELVLERGSLRLYKLKK